MSVRNLEELIRPYLAHQRKQFISCVSKSLLPPGENYGSTMLSLEIKVRDQNNVEEIIYCVAKMLPPNKALRDYFNTSMTFKKEITHYKTILPILSEFGKELGIEHLITFSATCIGSRISINPKSDTVDDDAVFVLENLKTQGFTVNDRFTGFDVETSKLILKDLATMHGSVIAYKLAKPKEFKQSILPNLNEAMVFVASDALLDNLIAVTLQYASRNAECVPILERIAKGIRKMKDFFVYSTAREPFATLVHTDLWVNNMLIKYENGKPIKNVFIDFPLCKYGSPARDLIFFIYSSLKLEFLPEKVDELIKFYYDNLIEVLTKLNCNKNEFTYKQFLEEVDEAARDAEFSHCIFMLTPIYTIPSEESNLEEWNVDKIAPPNEEMLHPNYHRKLQITVLDFARRNWI